MSLYDDTLNPDWEAPDLPGWEPWEPDEDIDVREVGCAYCGAPDVRDVPEPFGGKPCCDACFAIIIDDPGGPPFACLSCHPELLTERQETTNGSSEAHR